MGNNSNPYHEPELPEDSISEGCETLGEETIMEYVKKTHDFKGISEKDLEMLFSVLQKRCPDTWNPQLETRARNFYGKIKILRKENLSKYMDPEKEIPEKKKKCILNGNITAVDLITTPALWNMQEKEGGVELRELLRHFTIYAAFEGRPFVRDWFEALVPCFSRWLLQSDSGDNVVILTLKHFLGAFGQPAIVVCLADKGSSILKTLQDSARSVESVGRGTVERYYWKRLAESSCGGEVQWREVASIQDKPLELSQLDTLPPKWLLDVGDWVPLFANIVSPKITTRFGELIHEIVNSGDDVKADIHLGPSKTLDRSISKSEEYKKIFRERGDLMRWSRFRNKFKDVFGRLPKKPSDFVLNIVDFARCSIIVQSACDLLKVKKLIENQFRVVGVKNGYSSNVDAKGSGYRDFKMLVQVEFDNLKLGNVAKVEKKIVMICEVQLICAEWLKNKKTTSLSYKVIRSSTLRALLSDFSKYLQPEHQGDCPFKSDATNVIKNGWKNVARYTDFSNVDKDELLIESVSNGWNTAGVEILVNQLRADPNAKDRIGFTAACLASRWGHHNSLKKLIELRCDIEAADNTGWKPLKHAARWNREECVQVLLKAGCSLGEKDFESFVERYGKRHSYARVTFLLSGRNITPLKPKKIKSVTMIESAITAAVEGRLEQFFDSHDVPLSLVSELLSTEVIVKRIEHSLQLLWFGANVNGNRSSLVAAPLFFAISHGTFENVQILLDAKAKVDIKMDRGRVPRPAGLKDMKKVVQSLVKAKADIDSFENHDEKWTPIHCALRCARDKKQIINRK